MSPAPSTVLTSAATGTSVPLTQNTAPAIKFQCLFTHDIRRKAKRFQDGYLRFHTFNRRIMVYDTASNFIGDLHWQSSVDLEDGDEFELERGGILVQVLERLEKTDTDLTPLLERRNRSTGTNAAGSPPHQGNTSPPQPSGFSSSSSLLQYPAGRSKPLSELLGSKQTRIGGASFTTRSPFETKHDSRSNDDTAPNNFRNPAKRQKRTAAHDKENSESNDARSQYRQPRESPEPGNRSLSRQLDSDAAPTTRHANPSTTSGFQLASSIEITNESKTSSSRRKTSKKEPSAQQRSVAEIFAVESAASARPFATKKPRNKLVCKDLLSAPVKEREPKQRKEKEASNIKRESARNPPPDPIILSDDEDRTAVPTKDSTPMSTEGEVPLAFIPSASTLQAIEETAAPRSSQRETVISNFFKPSTSCTRGQEMSDTGHVEPPDGAVDTGNQMSETRSLNRSHSDLTPVPPEQERPEQQSARGALQKSFSDVSNLRARNNTASSASRSLQPKILPMTTAGADHVSSLDADEGERGPWTSEALELFDWWPPGRSKPP